MEIVFYSRNGRPIAYTQDGIHIYLFSGKPVAYLHEDSVYSFSGKHLGRFNEGWVRANNGYCVFFTENARGVPVRPVRIVKPVKGVKRIKPVKGVREIRPIRPVRKQSWSELSSESFFEQ
jgi:hypothetical protein